MRLVLTRWAIPIAVALTAVSQVPGSPADTGSTIDDVAAGICGGLSAKIGLQRFRQRFRSLDGCVSEVMPAAVAAVAACADDPDRGACLESRIRFVVDQYSGDDVVVGDVYTTRTGARVRVTSVVTSSVTHEERVAWAEYLDSLPHGIELVSVTLKLATPTDVRRSCGPSGLACYLPTTQTIVAAPSDAENAPGARALVAHEYAHHVANNRPNPPWQALDYGTKRWATYMRICERVRSRELTTRALWGAGYRLLPGEGFAEVYRLLSERRLAAAETSWLLVDDRFYPDAAALRLLEQDVLRPWEGPTTVRRTGRGSRSFRIATPLDGAVRVTVTSAAGSAHTVSAPTTVCGRRSIVVRVTSVRGTGSFRLTVSRP